MRTVLRAGILWLAAALAIPAWSARPGRAPVAVERVSQSATHAVFRLRPAAPRARGDALDLPYATRRALEGGAMVPVASVSLSVPRGVTVRLAEVHAEEVRLPGRLDVVQGKEPAGDGHGGAPELPPAVLEDAGYLGAHPFVRLRLHPLLPGPGGDAVRFRPEIRVVLEFTPDPTGPAAPRGSPYLDALAAEVLRPAPEPLSGFAWDLEAASKAVALLPPRIRIEVDTAGLHRVTGADLQAAGLSLASVDPATFALESGGLPVAIAVFDGGDGVFEPGDDLEFYGEPMTGRYTRRNVYWLSWGGAAGPRFGSRDGTPSGGAAVPASFPRTERREVNLVYTQNPPAAAENHWWWKRLNAPTSTLETLDLPGLAAAAHTVTLRVALQGRTAAVANPDHHTLIEVNAVQVDDQTWDGFAAFLHSVGVPSGLFAAAGNGIGIFLPGDTAAGSVDQIYVDYLEADYRAAFAASGDTLRFVGEGPGTFEFQVTGFSTTDLRVLELADPRAPVALEGAAFLGAGPFALRVEDSPAGPTPYLAVARAARRVPAGVTLAQPEDLLDPANGADHIIIAPPEFAAAAEPLRAHRAAQGFRARVVTTRDIYDVFSDGVFDPNAITDFLAHAYASWQAPPPAFVVLAGDASVDYLDYTGNGLQNWVPVLLVDTPGFGETPTDNTYAMVNGADLLPDLFVGRFPAQSAAQLTGMVDKLIAYETATPFAELNAQALFVADDDDVSFAAILDNRIDTFLPSGIAPARVYLPPTSDGSAERVAIRAAVDAGALTTVYFGHGNLSNWAAENLWLSSDVATLANDGRQTFVASLNCINGYFANFQAAASYSLLEEWVRHPDRGAVAGWAPSALSTVPDYDTISFELFSSLYDGIYGMLDSRLGTAAVGALVRAVSLYGVSPVNAQELIFFGDPATVFPLDADGDQVPDGLDNCVGTANPDQLDSDQDGVGDLCDPDDDADGVEDPADCAPLDPGAWAVPAEVSGLRVTGTGTLDWDAQVGSAGPAVVYDVIRGSVTQARSEGGMESAACMVSGTASPSSTDPAAPPADAAYYLVRARNSCGDGGYGAASSGAPRLNGSCP